MVKLQVQNSNSLNIIMKLPHFQNLVVILSHPETVSIISKCG